jgi:hypothetical protein
MKMFYVNTNTGYIGTDEMLEIEADNASEAWDVAQGHLMENITIDVYDTEEEAEENV